MLGLEAARFKVQGLGFNAQGQGCGGSGSPAYLGGHGG